MPASPTSRRRRQLLPPPSSPRGEWARRGCTPASSAARIWRRVPVSSRFVHAQRSETGINSTSLRGSTLLFHGFVPRRNSSSAPWGSHSLSLSREESHGFIGGAGLTPDCLSVVFSFKGVIVTCLPFERLNARALESASLSRRADGRRKRVPSATRHPHNADVVFCLAVFAGKFLRE